ncbi:MAG: DedA family protein [Acidimicrobiales bacterium]|jgi:membrane protein DedA with SNARE-associated domain
MQHLLSSWGYLALALLTFSEAACVPIPSEVTLGYAGYLASTGRLDLAAVIVISIFGELLGSFVGWSIGRFGGRSLVSRFGRYVLLTNSDLDRAERWFRKRGEPAVFFGRILPVIRTFISIPAGVAEMGLVRFGAATFAGSAVWCTAIGLVAYELGGEWTKLTRGFSAAGYVLAAVAVGAIVVFVIHRFLAVRRERSGALR